MIEQETALTKINEIYDEYSNQYIDDYDVFVCSRAVEYFLNDSSETSDVIIDLIRQTLRNNKNISSAESAFDDCDDEDASEDTTSDIIADSEEEKFDEIREDD